MLFAGVGSFLEMGIIRCLNSSNRGIQRILHCMLLACPLSEESSNRNSRLCCTVELRKHVNGP
jgi:hypothetical protein